MSQETISQPVNPYEQALDEANQHEADMAVQNVAAQEQAAAEQRAQIAQQKAEELTVARDEAYGTLMPLIESGKPLDGPTLTGAGLGFEKRSQLGYHGGMDTMVEDAKVWQAQKEEAARRDDYHAANKAKADAWRAEADALRAPRDEANARISELVDGTAAVKTTVSRSKMTQEEAITRAADEGHDVSHTSPKKVAVIRNAAAELQASETVAALRDFNASVAAGQNTAAEKRAAAAQEGAVDSAADTQISKFDKLRAWLFGSDKAEAVIGAPATNPETGTITRDKKSIRDTMGAIGAKLSNLQDRGYTKLIGAMNRNSEPLTPEQQRSRKRMASAVVVGLIGVAAATTAAKFGGLDFLQVGGGGGNLAAGHHGGGTNPDMISKLGGGHGTTEHHAAMTGVMDRGENPWDNSEAALKPGATNQQVAEVTNRTMDINGWTDDRHIPVGEYKMPQHLIEEINKQITEDKAA